MKKRLIILWMILIGCTLVSCGSNNKISMTDEKIQNNTIAYDNGDTLFIPLEENLKYDEDSYSFYYNNLLDVYLFEDLEADEADSLAESVNGKIVGDISGSINRVQIMVPDYDMDDYDKLRQTLLQTGKVLSVIYAFPFTIEEQTTLVNPVSSTEAADSFDLVDTSLPGNWWMDAVRMPTAWSFTEYAEDYIVGIMDSGFDEHGEAFFSDGCTKFEMFTANSEDDHGTEVAGLLAAFNWAEQGIRGVASDAILLGIDNTENNIEADETFDVYIKRIIENGAKVVNCSFGPYHHDKKHYLESYIVDNLAEELNVKKEKISYEQYLNAFMAENEKTNNKCISIMVSLMMNDAKFLIVEGSGNGYNNYFQEGYDMTEDGGFFLGITEERYEQWLDTNCGPYIGDPFKEHNISYKTLMDHLIVVGAATNEQDKLGRYLAARGSNFGSCLDILAPGVDLRVVGVNNKITENGKGTSFATPIVAGAAAYLWALNPKMDSAQVKERLLFSASASIGVTGVDKGVEHKMIDVGSAVISVVMGNVSFNVVDDKTGEILEDLTCTRDCDDTDDPIFCDELIIPNGDDIYAAAIGHCTYTLHKDGYQDSELSFVVGMRENLALGTVLMSKDFALEDFFGYRKTDTLLEVGIGRRDNGELYFSTANLFDGNDGVHSYGQHNISMSSVSSYTISGNTLTLVIEGYHTQTYTCTLNDDGSLYVVDNDGGIWTGMYYPE